MLDLRGEPGCWAFTLDLTFRETLGFGTCKSATYWWFPSSNWDLRSIWGKQKVLHGDVEPLSNHGDQQKCIFPVRGGVYPRMTLPRKWPNVFSLKGCQVDSENEKTEMYTKAMFVADHITADQILWMHMDAWSSAPFTPRQALNQRSEMRMWNMDSMGGGPCRTVLESPCGQIRWTQQKLSAPVAIHVHIKCNARWD